MRNKFSNALWGLFFIFIGIGFAGNVMNLWDFQLFFKGWWTFLIIIPCFISMLQHGFGTGSTIGFVIGVLLFMNYYVRLDFNLMRLLIPAILIFIGVRIMFQSAFRKKSIHFHKEVHSEGQTSSSYSSGNYREHSAIFASNRIDIGNEVFTGTNLNAVFGGIVLDLRNAIIEHDVEINASAIFAGIDIYVPRGIQIKVNNVPVFGGVSNKSDSYREPGAPTIYLNSTCMFGGIDIK